MPRTFAYTVACVVLAAAASPFALAQVDGTGTANKIPKFIDSNTIGDSSISQGASGGISMSASTSSSMLQLEQSGTGPIARFRAAGLTKFQVTSAGGVGIGTSSFTPVTRLHVRGDGTGSTQNRIRMQNGSKLLDLRADGAEVDVESTTHKLVLQGNGVVALQPFTGRVGIGTFDPGTTLDVNGAITIRGGSDLAEPFRIHDEKVEAGMVVAIDPERPGEVRLSREPYDTKVVGVVSGAGGVNTGMMMYQEGTIAGNHPIALVGRVHCWSDASFGAIQAGDLLTTSPTPGFAMKASDSTRATGAILGKAMSALPEGRGLVWIVVSLQ